MISWKLIQEAVRRGAKEAARFQSSPQLSSPPREKSGPKLKAYSTWPPLVALYNNATYLD